MNMRGLLIGGLCCLFTAQLQAQEKDAAGNKQNIITSQQALRGSNVNLEDEIDISSFLKNAILSPTWIPHSNSFYYAISTDSSNLYYFVHATKGTKTLLTNTAQLAQQLAPYVGVKVDPKQLRIHPEINIRQPHQFKFFYKSQGYLYNTKNQKLTQVFEPKLASKPFNFSANTITGKVSKDRAWVAYGYKHDVYVRSLHTTDSFRLTHDGEPYYSFTSSNATATDEKLSPSIVQWMKNGTKLVALREDKRLVGEMSITNSLAQPRPITQTYKFPMPGDKHVVQYELFLFDAAQQSTIKLPVEKYKDQKIILQTTLVNGRMPLQAGPMAEQERYVYFLRKNRAASIIELCRLDTETGTIKELIHETCAPHLNEQLFTCRILNNGKDILWWSERSGKGAYYLYDSAGKLKQPIGDLNFVAGDIHSIDTAATSFIFEGYGMDTAINPNYRMYFKADWTKGIVTLLTPENGYHDIQVAPSGKYFIDSYSTMNMPPQHVLKHMNGKKVLALESATINGLPQMGWTMPELFRLKAPDNSTWIYGVIYKPLHFDSTQQYPIISNVYPGPQEDVVAKKFTIDDNYNQSLAQLGFIVVTMGHRGSSPFRGHAFHNFGYGNLRDYALADDKFIIEQLAAQRPYMNINKVGIYGHSGGGFMSASALLTYPDFYKVAVAASGNFDSNIYTQWWGETYHGIDSTAAGFKVTIPTTIELADKLKGKLLLITGDMDNNVHPANTFRLADALIKKNKYFDMMILPGKDHGLGDMYYNNLIRRYFLTHLR